MQSAGVYEKIPFENTGFPIRINYHSTLTSGDGSPAPLTWHEQMELLYFRTGGAQVRCGSRLYTAQSGDLILINPFEIHSVVYCCGTPCYDCIMVDASLYSDAQKVVCEMHDPDSMSRICFENIIGNDPQAVGYIRNILSEFQNKSFAYELAVKADILGFFVYLFRNKAKDGLSFKELVHNAARFERLKPAFDYMKENLSREISLETLARVCSLNSAHLCRVFKQCIGITPMQYLSNLRLSAAEAMLKTTDKSISQVADDVGIPDISYFSKKFRAYTGLTPTQVKNSVHICFPASQMKTT